MRAYLGGTRNRLRKRSGWSVIPAEFEVLENRALLSPLDFSNLNDSNGVLSGDVEEGYDHMGMVEIDFDDDGLADESVEVDSNNHFSINLVTELGEGSHTVKIRVTGMDPVTYEPVETSWQSQSIDIDIDNPDIIEFDWEYLGSGLYKFTGEVTHDYPDLVTINFGGIADGESTVVNADGTFSIVIDLGPGAFGSVTAIAVDTLDQESDEEELIL